MVEELIKDLPHSGRAYVVLILIGLISPPYWFMFEFCKPIFNQYSTLTLILLSLSVGFPIAFLNSLFFAGKLTVLGPDGKPTGLSSFFFFTMMSMPIYFVPEVLTYFEFVSQKTAIFISTGCELIVLVTAVIIKPTTA